MYWYEYNVGSSSREIILIMLWPLISIRDNNSYTGGGYYIRGDSVTYGIYEHELHTPQQLYGKWL